PYALSGRIPPRHPASPMSFAPTTQNLSRRGKGPLKAEEKQDRVDCSSMLSSSPSGFFFGRQRMGISHGYGAGKPGKVSNRPTVSIKSMKAFVMESVGYSWPALTSNTRDDFSSGVNGQHSDQR